jgi:uroporphyrin-III C-methyltransferase
MAGKRQTLHKVYIAGAGPGDPELLTLKTYRLLREYADVVVYDRLVPTKILKLIPKKVQMVYAGKSCRTHIMTQDEINAELVSQAKSGKKVVRLKGGDPFIFGRGGEEIEHLAKNGIPFEVVPGISSASAISSLLGVPLTHRGLATGVRFITGHQQKGEAVKLDWKGLANNETTLVVYMGLANLENITKHLIKAGLPASTPAVAVENGTLPGEKRCYSAVKSIAAQVKRKKFEPPTLVIIGKVVSVSQRLEKLLAKSKS